MRVSVLAAGTPITTVRTRQVARRWQVTSSLEALKTTSEQPSRYVVLHHLPKLMIRLCSQGLGLLHSCMKDTQVSSLLLFPWFSTTIRTSVMERRAIPLLRALGELGHYSSSPTTKIHSGGFHKPMAFPTNTFPT